LPLLVRQLKTRVGSVVAPTIETFIVPAIATFK
jgi:hypothetical protein